MQSNPIVSVIIPTLSRTKMLRRAINSVEAQSYTPKQLIVVGAPETPDISDMLSSRDISEVEYIDANATSISEARNAGIRESKGNYIAFLDDDDEWIPEKVSRQVQRIQETGAEFCYAGVRNVGPDGRVRGVFEPPTQGNVSKTVFEEKICGTPSSLMVKHQSVINIGMFDEGLMTFEEGDFVIRLAQQYELCSISEPLTIRHSGSHEQVSGNVRQRLEFTERFISKHRSTARDHGKRTEQRWISNVRLGNAKSAAAQGEFKLARKEVMRALHYEQLHLRLYLWLILVSGGTITYEPVKLIKRMVVRSLANS